MFKNIVLVLLLLLTCILDGYFHYKEQDQILSLEWAVGNITLERDMMAIRLHRCLSK